MKKQVIKFNLQSAKAAGSVAQGTITNARTAGAVPEGSICVSCIKFEIIDTDAAKTQDTRGGAFLLSKENGSAKQMHNDYKVEHIQ